MRGYTKKPCHGCGEVPKDYHGRPTEGVCGDCADLLRFARLQKTQLATTENLETFLFPESYYRLPYLSHVKTAFRGDERKPADVFSQTYLQLLHRLGRITENRVPFTIRNYPHVIEGSEGSDVGVMDRDTRRYLNSIYQAVVAMLKEAYEAGKKDGRSLIVGLAAGDVSIETFNRAATDK